VAILESCRGLEGVLLAWVRLVCERLPAADVPTLARAVMRDPDFRRANRLVMQSRAAHCEVPSCEVREHLREGRRVRANFRYLGLAHLAEISLVGQPDPVPAVIRCLVSGGHHRGRERGSAGC